ncbi:MAG: methionyl-tRNA formyltransferase [Cryobacterium sp.]|jgi:methionyl-tRNA formyltransferase|nr:methionyl-tRNA formyltransferase [Cryobacterium sp.]
MKLVFAGTPEAAVPSLAMLAASSHDLATVITRADAPVGRKRVLTSSPVAQAAHEQGLPILKANRLGDDLTEVIARLAPDLGVIVAYGGLVREPLLSVPRLGWINLHFSLLPRWRGAAPVQHAVIAGDALTGAAIFKLVPGLDAGPVYATLVRPIGADDTAGDVLEELSVTGATLLRDVVEDIAAGTASATEQEGEVTLAPKLGIDDARVDWSRPAAAVYNRVRGVTPEPGAFTVVAGARVKLLAVRSAAFAPDLPAGHLDLREGRVLIGTGTHPLELVNVQPSGKKAMPAVAWWRGAGRDGLVAS